MDVFQEIYQLFRIEKPVGYPVEAIDAAKKAFGGMPGLLEQFYLKCGLSDELQGLQDSLILPDRYPVFKDYDYLIFFNENQGVCQTGIHKNDLSLWDPPVYAGYDNKEWIKTSDRLSDFLPAMFGYQASICLEYSPFAFYWISQEEKAEIEGLFPKRPESLKSWIYCEIELYGDPHFRIALMNTGGEFQMNYAANSQSSFQLVQAALKDIGEVM